MPGQWIPEDSRIRKVRKIRVGDVLDDSEDLGKKETVCVKAVRLTCTSFGSMADSGSGQCFDLARETAGREGPGIGCLL